MQDIYKDLEKQLSSRSEFYKYLKIFTYRSYRLYGKDYFCDICLVKDKKSKKKKKEFVKLQKRWHGVTKNMASRGENKPRWIIIGSYNFPQKFEFERVRKIFNDISKGEIKISDFEKEESAADFAIEEIKRLSKKIRKLESKKRKDKNTKKQLSILRKQAKFLDNENKILKKNTLKSQIPSYRKIIKKATSTLSVEGESYFQELFTDNTWIFGPAYEEIIPKRKADPQNEPDFALKRYDGFSDIVEIEEPSKKLFTKPNRSKKSQPTSELIQAIAQIMDYIESYNMKHKDLFYDDSIEGMANPLHAYYPRGFVIIGRDKNTDKKKLRQLNHFLHDIVVLTYDEFLRQAEKMLSILEK